MRHSSKSKIIFIIDIDRFDQDSVVRDQHGRIVASVRVTPDACHIEIGNAVDAVQFRGKGQGKNVRIDSRIPCGFLEKELQFNNLLLNGGPYHFQEGTDLHVARFNVDGLFVFKKSQVQAQALFVVSDSAWIEDSTITTPTLDLKNIRQMKRVEIHGVNDDATCELHFSKQASVNHVFIETSQLSLSSLEGTVHLKKIHATFDQIEFISGHCQFWDSQLRDKAQTSEQMDRFQRGMSSLNFKEWHQAQSTIYLEKNEHVSRMVSGARVTLLRSSFLISTFFRKESGAALRVEQQSVFGARRLDAVDHSANPDKPTLAFKESLLVLDKYDQTGGAAAFSHVVWQVNNTLNAQSQAVLIVVDQTSVTAGSLMRLFNVDYYQNNSLISTQKLIAFGEQGLVVIKDRSLQSLHQRRVALKAADVAIDCGFAMSNVIVRIGFGYFNKEIEIENSLVIASDQVVTDTNSHVRARGMTLDSTSLYIGGKFDVSQRSCFIVRNQCILSENGEIKLQGQIIGRFGEFAQLGQLHVERDLTRVTPTLIAKEGRFHTGSKITGDGLVMDIDDVQLSGKIDLTDRFKLITKFGKLRGSIQSKESIELAADYLLTNLGGRLNAPDLRIVGNYLSFLGQVQARRSYSQVGGLILDSDLVFANNMMTASLISVSLGFKLPNPHSRLEDLLTTNNFIRAGLTILNFLAPHLAPLANATYFASKLVQMVPMLAQVAENGSLEELRTTRPHQWMKAISYVAAMGMSTYQEFAYFHLDADEPAPHLDAETLITRILPAFVSGEMNSSLIIFNSGMNLLPSSLNNALVVENAGVNVHVNDTVTALLDVHSGLDIADNRMETVQHDIIQGLVVSRIQTLFATHMHIVPRGHTIVTDRAQWNIDDADNEGALTIDSQHDDSVVQMHQFTDKGQSVLTGVTVSGFQFVSSDQSQERFQDVAFRDTIHIDNGHTSYTGYYVIQTTNYSHHGTREALDTQSETLFSLKSDDAEFEGVVCDNKAHIEVKNLKNVKDFLQEGGQYKNYHVITALELVTQQALALHGLNRDCDVSITAKGVHFDDDVTFHHNVYIHSDTTETIDHDIHSDHYLYVEANGNIILESKLHTDPREQQAAVVVDVKDGAYVKSDHGSIQGKGVDANGKELVFDADKDINLDKRFPNMHDWREMQQYLMLKELSQASGPVEMIAIIKKYAQMQAPVRDSVLTSDHIYEHSAEGNIYNNGEARASDNLTIVADKGHVTSLGAFSAGDKVFISADTGFDLLSERYLKQGRYGAHAVYSPSTLTGGAGGLTVHVAHGDANVDASDMHATGDIFVDASNINLLAHTVNTVTNVEHHSGFLGFHSHDQVTETTNVFRDHIISDSGQVILRAHNVLQSHGADVHGQKGTYLIGEKGAQISDITGHTRTVTKDSSFWGLTYHRTDHDQEFNVSTSIVDSTQAVIYSPDGDVISVGTFFMTPNGTIAGKNVSLYQRILNNTWSEETRGLHASLFGVPILSSYTSCTPFHYTNPTWSLINTAAHSHGPTESGLNYANLGINVYNVAQAFESGLTSGNVLASVAQQEGLSPSFDVGLQTTNQSGSYQTLGSGGFYTGNLTVSAENRVLFDGTPVVATHDATIHAKQFDQVGTALQSQSTYHTEDMTLGFSLNGTLDHAAFNASQAASQSQMWVNQQFSVGGTLHMDVANWMLDGANTDANKFDGEVKEKLTIKTHLTTADSHSSSEQFDTKGNFGGSVSNQHDESIGETAGLHIENDATVKAHEIDLSGGKITDDKKLEVDADTINGERIQTDSKSDSFGISGSVQNFGTHEYNGAAPNHIDTTTFTDVGSRHHETQQSVIHGASETIIKAQEIHGNLDTTDSHGSHVDRDQHWDYHADIPTGFEHDSQHVNPIDHPISPVTDSAHKNPEADTQDVDSHESDVISPADFSDQDMAIKPADSDQIGTNLLAITNPLDFVADNISTFDQQNVTLISEDFEDQAIEQLNTRQRINSVGDDTKFRKDKITMNADDFESPWPQDINATDDQFIDPAYLNALVTDPTNSLMIYDVNRQAANMLYGRSVFYDPSLSFAINTTQTENDDTNFFSKVPVSILAMGQDFVHDIGPEFLKAADDLGDTLSNMTENFMWGIAHDDPVETLEGFGKQAVNTTEDLLFFVEKPIIGIENFFLRSMGDDPIIPVYLPITPEQQPGADLFNLSLMFIPVADTVGVTDSIVEVSLLTGRGLFARSVLLDPAIGVGAESLPNFSSRDLLESHFIKHGAEFRGAFDTPDEYLSGAHDVIKDGIKVAYEYRGETRIGYVKFMGNVTNGGAAKFEFVGTNGTGSITTYHIEGGKKFWKTLNADPQFKNITPYDYIEPELDFTKHYTY